MKVSIFKTNTINHIVQMLMTCVEIRQSILICFFRLMWCSGQFACNLTNSTGLEVNNHVSPPVTLRFVGLELVTSRKQTQNLTN